MKGRFARSDIYGSDAPSMTTTEQTVPEASEQNLLAQGETGAFPVSPGKRFSIWCFLGGLFLLTFVLGGNKVV